MFIVLTNLAVLFNLGAAWSKICGTSAEPGRDESAGEEPQGGAERAASEEPRDGVGRAVDKELQTGRTAGEGRRDERGLRNQGRDGMSDERVGTGRVKDRGAAPQREREREGERERQKLNFVFD